MESQIACRAISSYAVGSYRTANNRVRRGGRQEMPSGVVSPSKRSDTNSRWRTMAPRQDFAKAIPGSTEASMICEAVPRRAPSCLSSVVRSGYIPKEIRETARKITAQIGDYIRLGQRAIGFLFVRLIQVIKSASLRLQINDVLVLSIYHDDI